MSKFTPMRNYNLVNEFLGDKAKKNVLDKTKLYKTTTDAIVVEFNGCDVLGFFPDGSVYIDLTKDNSQLALKRINQFLPENYELMKAEDGFIINSPKEKKTVSKLGMIMNDGSIVTE